MPKVAAKKKNKSRTSIQRRGSADPGLLEQGGAALDVFMQRAARLLVTYTAVSITGAVIILVLMLFAGGYFFNVGTRLTNLSVEASKAAGFQVTRITLRGAEQTRSQDIISALYDQERGQAVGRSLLHFDLAGARERVEAIGWVRDAAVARFWPNTIHISVSERTPAALWQPSGAGELFLIDQEGAVITEVGSHQYTGLPMIMNTDNPNRAKALLTELARFPSMSVRIAALREQGNRRWDLVFRDEFYVMLPEDNFEKALAKLNELDQEAGGLSGTMSYLDLRNPDTVYYDLKS